MTKTNSLRARFGINNTLAAVITRSFISGIEQSMIGVVFQQFENRFMLF